MGKAHRNRKKPAHPKSEEMQRLLGRSTLSIESKLLLYKAVPKPIRTYGIQIKTHCSVKKKKK
jgi:hypothetical protein